MYLDLSIPFFGPILTADITAALKHMVMDLRGRRVRLDVLIICLCCDGRRE